MSEIILSAFTDEAAADLAGQLRAMQANGLQAMDLRAVDGINVADLTPAKTRQVRDALSAEGFSVACLASPIGKIGIGDPFAPHLDKMKRLCETADLLDCRRVRFFSFFIPAGQTAADCRAEVLERLDQLLRIGTDAGLRLLHENEKDIYGDITERCLDLHQVFGERMGGIVDPANYLQVGSDPLQAMQTLNQWIEYLHIKDVRLSDGKLMPAGQGDGHVAEIIKLYTAIPERRHIAVEPHLFAFSGLSKLEKNPVSQKAAATGGLVSEAEQALAVFATAISACRTLLPD